MRYRYGAHIELLRWMHLDDTEKVDAVRVHSGKGELHRLPISMAAKRGYLRISMAGDATQRECAQEIIERVFGGMTNIMPFLLQHATSSELAIIRGIINRKQV